MSSCVGGQRARQLSAEAAYSEVHQLFVAGELGAARSKAHSAEADYAKTDQAWSARFRLEEARISLYQGESSKSTELLRSGWSSGAVTNRLAAERAIVLSLADAALGNYERARQDIVEAEQICKADRTADTVPLRGELLSAQGLLALESDRLSEAETYFERTLIAAREASDKFLEVSALLNLSVVAFEREHFEDALERSTATAALAQSIGARQVLEKALGNTAWASYQIGDFERATQESREAEHRAAQLGAISDQVQWLDISGLSDYRLGKIPQAESFYRRSLELAKSLQNDERAGDADVALASLQLQSGQNAAAAHTIQEAEQLAIRRKSTVDQLPPRVLHAQLLMQQGEPAAARAMLVDVEHNTHDWPSLRWEAQRSLARLAGQMGDQRSAGLWFQRSIATYRAQRSSLRSDDTKLPFFANGRDLYLDYADFLVSQHQENAALALIDQGRAETLAEGLGLKDGTGQGGTKSALDARTLARRLHATLLVYSLAPQHSYLWAANGKRTGFYQLPGTAEILPLVASHRQALLAARDLAGEQEAAGRALYEKLVLPAQGLIEPGDRIYIVADEGLHGLNFETLLTPGKNSHYWIEDVIITHAASLRLLAASGNGGTTRVSAMRGANVLVVGNPVYTTQQFAPLPNAADEVNGVAAHFPQHARTLLTGAHASPAAYLAGKPENFDYIHFVAHAVASEITPLDSAVVLSNPTSGTEDAKLYAREILSRPLHAELVTISACQGSGIRAYAGEGLVGLAWAFLRAGSKNVIGALWDVSDASTPELMEHLYGQLEQGQPPDAALRAAKLAMLHSPGVFRKPIYWGAFQLYAGGGSGSSPKTPAADTGS